MRVALLVIVCWYAGGSAARADTVTLEEYRARLSEARAHVAAGRVELARELLRRTTAVIVRGATVTVDDSALASRVEDVDLRLADAQRAALPDDGAASDARLAVLVQARGAGAFSFIEVLLSLASTVWDRLGRPSVASLLYAQAAAGLALALVIAVVLLRGVRERVRRETALPRLAAERTAAPLEHLAEAAGALRRGDARSAIHAYYRFAIASLAAREAVGYDPALTDRELLRRAAGMAHVDSLRELVALHERVWFGVRAAAVSEAQLAGRLAERVAA